MLTPAPAQTAVPALPALVDRAAAVLVRSDCRCWPWAIRMN